MKANDDYFKYLFNDNTSIALTVKTAQNIENITFDNIFVHGSWSVEFVCVLTSLILKCSTIVS